MIKKQIVQLVPDEIISNQIYLIRKQKVMLDSDLARLYEVETKVLKQAVKRNIDRFPEDFMFEITKQESDSLRSQFALITQVFMDCGRLSIFLIQVCKMLLINRLSLCIPAYL